MIICITGLPGSGKSTVADMLKGEFERCNRGVLHYTPDWMRFKLFPELMGNSGQHGRGFSQDELERSYNGLYMLFSELLGVDKKLVLLTDGTYRKEYQRNALRQITTQYNTPFVLIKVV